MSNNEQPLPAHGGCPHCDGHLEAATDNGMLTVCEQCHCLFFQGMVVSYRRCDPRGPAHGVTGQEQELASG
jgi:hypothetical protein